MIMTTPAERILCLTSAIVTLAIHVVPALEPHHLPIVLCLGALIPMWLVVAWAEATRQSIVHRESGWLAVPRRMLSSTNRTLPVAVVIVLAMYITMKIGLEGPTYWIFAALVASSVMASGRYVARQGELLTALRG